MIIKQMLNINFINDYKTNVIIFWMKCYIFYKHIQDILYFVVLNIKKIKKEFILNKWLITILNIVQNIKWLY